MSFNLKYYLNFKDLNQNQHLVQIYENVTGSTTSAEIKGVKDPFIIEYPSRNKFDTVCGSGCELNLLSESNMFFFTNLYTNDPQHFMVKHYINSVINWYGYLNSELFRETFTQLSNYPVQLTCNDGFSLMDRFKFVDGSGNAYTGLKSYFDIIQIIFTKIGLPFSELRVATTTTFSGYTGGSTNIIFQSMYINCANFYDEDGKPMTMREVLDEILKPFQCYIFQSGGNVYLNDYNNIATNSSITYKRYMFPSLTYTGTTVESNVFVLTGSTYMQSSGEITTGGGINKQVVAYSPYINTTIIPECIKDNSEYTTVASSYTTVTDGLANTKNIYYYRSLGGNKTFNLLSGGSWEESYYQDPTSTNCYIKFVPASGINKVLSLIVNPFISIGGGTATKKVALKISGKMLPKTKIYVYNTAAPSIYTIQEVWIKCQLKVGSYYWDNSNIGIDAFWNTTAAYCYIKTNIDNADGNMADKFNDIGRYNGNVIINIPNHVIDGYPSTGLNGLLYFDIFTDAAYRTTAGSALVYNTSAFQECWLSNLKISVVDGITYKDLTSTDVEYQGYLDPNFQNEGSKITLKVGSDSTAVDRGKIVDLDNISIINFSRASNSNKRIENLLLNSVISNYQNSNISINGLILKNQFNLNNIIVTPYFSGKQFCLNSIKTNYSDAQSEINIIEIFQDNLTI